MNRTRLSESLEHARSKRHIVRITRRVESGTADGYIVASAGRWLLLLLIGDDVHYAGFQAFRLRDVSSITVPSPHASFYEKALRMRAAKRPRTPAVTLDSLGDLLKSAGKQFTLITIHREIVDPGVCHIGRLVAVTKQSVSLQEITPDAIWEEGVTEYRLTEITRVDFGGAYEEALALVADC